MRLITLITIALFAAYGASAQQPPLYIVNGQQMEDIRSIPPEDILSTELLPADEQSVALYGDRANHGVVVVQLRYDTPAKFLCDEGSFSQYVASRVEWGELERVARYVVRFRVLCDGTIALGEELQCSEPRFRRRVLKALENLPLWQPAMKDGVAVESSHVLRVQLPEGAEMPVEPAVILL